MNLEANLFMMAITFNISIATNYCADYFETKMYLVKSYFFIEISPIVEMDSKKKFLPNGSYNPRLTV